MAALILMIARQLSAFSPTSIANLGLWFDAADASTISLSGANVTQWNDKSGNARNATQASGANQPTYVSNGFNNKACIHFNGSSSYMSTSSFQLFTSSSSGLTVFLVFNTSTTGQSYLLNHPESAGSNTNSNFELGINPAANSAGSFGVHRGAAAATLTGANFIPVNTNMIVTTRILTSGAAPSNVVIYKNGVSQSPITSNGGWWGAGSYPITNIWMDIGARRDGNSGSFPLGAFHQGDIAEIIVYQRDLTVPERQQVESYLASKWNLMPAMVSNIAAWYDAMDGASLKLSGSNVIIWRDKSGRADDATAPSGNEPLKVSNSINRNQALNFNGSNQYMNFDGSFLNGTAYTLFILEKKSGPNGSCDMIAGPNGSTNANLHFGYRSEVSADTDFNLAQFNNDLDVTILNNFNIPMIWTGRLNTSTGHTLYKNSHLIGSNANTATLAGNVSTIANQYSGSSFYKGNIGEIIFYTRALSDPERLQIEDYLRAKWNLGPNSVHFGTNF